MANYFKNAGIEAGTTRSPLYTCPAGSTGVIHALYVSNVGTASSDIDIEITVDGGTTYRYIGKGLAVPENSTLVLDKPINLESNDILAVTSSIANSVEAVCAVLEIN